MILELENFYWEEIESIEIIEDGDCYDLCVLEEDVYLGEPNYIAEDIVVHNSGMHEEFIARKHGKKKWSVPTVGDVDFINLMKSTYSVLVYQEQVMRYLSVVGKIPISQCQGVIKAISKKKVEKFQKYKDEFVKNAQITLNISHEEAVKEWENIESFASYGFNLAHSVAYTVASVRQLWQKSHYAIEFFVKDLAHLKTGDDRIQIYKDDAEAHGIRCRGLHLNNSDVNFSIVDKNGNRDQLAAEGDEIYYGFSKIKGIGEEVAKEIVKGQPYLGFVDFLNRFGTSANVVPALIALRVFKEADPVTLYKFYEVYKRDHKREVDRTQRNRKSVEKYINTLRSMVPQELDWITFDEVDFSKARPYVTVALWQEMLYLKKKYDRCVNTYESKIKEADDVKMNLDLEKFKPDLIKIDPEMEKLLLNHAEAEKAYYGFEWEHPLTKYEEYLGYTLASIHMNATRYPLVVPVEILIKSREQGMTKTGKPMLKIRGEDALRHPIMVTVWKEEIDRFIDDFKPGNCIRARVKVEQAKGQDNYWYNLESFGWQDRGQAPKDKESDIRVFVFKRKKENNGFSY